MPDKDFIGQHPPPEQYKLVLALSELLLPIQGVMRHAVPLQPAVREQTLYTFNSVVP